MNHEAVKGLEIGLAAPLNFAFGAEFRRDHYQINPGAKASYEDGEVRILDGPNAGKLGAVGAQVFPGFRPSDAGSHDRTNVGVYLDLETRPVDGWLLGVAARYEDYSDFGSELTWKVATRVELSKAIALRGAYSTGFRAPSLGQSWFSSTATNFINGVPFENKTFPVSDPVAVALGATPLTPETSVNLSAGVALQPARNFSLTADYYRITIDDRIVLSGNFNQKAVQDFLVAQGFRGVSGARFFTNAIDTETEGVDLVASYSTLVGKGALSLTGGYNATSTKVTRVTPTPGILEQYEQTLFDSVERVRVERGQPKNNLMVMGVYSISALSFTARTQQYGSFFVRSASTDRTLDQAFGAKWVTDFSASYRFANRLTMTVGVDNAFDTFPDQFSTPDAPSATVGGSSFFGILPWSGQSPTGFNGMYYFGRLSFVF